MPFVLVCTSSTLADRCIPKVLESIRARGLDVLCVDTARFPLDAQLDLDLDRARVTSAGTCVDLEDVAAVWNTHINVGTALGEDVDPAYHAIVAAQSELALSDLLARVDAFQLDPPNAVFDLPVGTAQLVRARSVGLEVPRTIVTNDPDRVRAFAREHDNVLVAKMLHSSIVTQEAADGTRRGYSPRIIGEEELAEAERITLCPMIFQERIPKALELRITVVGEQLFTAAVDSSSSEACAWSDDPALVRGFRKYDGLPDDVRRAVLRLLDGFGLNFGTVDMIVTPDGRHVYLETNPVSFYDFIEESTGMLISRAIADLLTGHAARRPCNEPLSS